MHILAKEQRARSFDEVWSMGSWGSLFGVGLRRIDILSEERPVVQSVDRSSSMLRIVWISEA